MKIEEALSIYLYSAIIAAFFEIRDIESTIDGVFKIGLNDGKFKNEDKSKVRFIVCFNTVIVSITPILNTLISIKWFFRLILNNRE